MGCDAKLRKAELDDPSSRFSGDQWVLVSSSELSQARSIRRRCASARDDNVVQAFAAEWTQSVVFANLELAARARKDLRALERLKSLRKPRRTDVAGPALYGRLSGCKSMLD
jgi:hypothetical protein